MSDCPTVDGLLPTATVRAYIATVHKHLQVFSDQLLTLSSALDTTRKPLSCSLDSTEDSSGRLPRPVDSSDTATSHQLWLTGLELPESWLADLASFTELSCFPSSLDKGTIQETAAEYIRPPSMAVLTPEGHFNGDAPSASLLSPIHQVELQQRREDRVPSPAPYALPVDPSLRCVLLGTVGTRGTPEDVHSLLVHGAAVDEADAVSDNL
jgi:hypothetical protein